MMSTSRIGAVFTLGLAAFFLGIAPAHAAPTGCPAAVTVADGGCSATLISVTASTTDGTITGTPVGGVAPITLAGQSDSYLKSTGFAGTPPDPVQQWDATIDRVNALPPPGAPNPNWYGNGKASAFLPRQLNDLAAQFPPDTIVVRFVPDDTNPGWFRLLSIQPVGS